MRKNPDFIFQTKHWWKCFLLVVDFMETPQQISWPFTKMRKDDGKRKKEEEWWLTGGVTSAFQTLNIWILQMVVSSASSLERTAEDTPTRHYSTQSRLLSIVPFFKMANCGTLLKCALVAIVLVALSQSGSAGKINWINKVRKSEEVLKWSLLYINSFIFLPTFSWEAGILL